MLPFTVTLQPSAAGTAQYCFGGLRVAIALSP
jgi:hypothetical protein